MNRNQKPNNPQREPPTENIRWGRFFRLLISLAIKYGVVGVEILGVQMILGNAEGVAETINMKH